MTLYMDQRALQSLTRPTWDEYFFRIAKVVSSRASCPRASVGAVIVANDNTVVSTGYNGAPPGENDCITHGCTMANSHCQRAIHAEVNAVVFGERARLKGSKLYLYSSRGDTEPCQECQKVLRAAGVVW